MTSDNNSNKEEAILLKDKEIKKRLKYLEEWNLSPEGKSIVREIEFNRFKKAIGFVNELARHSEEINHYPKTITIQKT